MSNLPINVGEGFDPSKLSETAEMFSKWQAEQAANGKWYVSDEGAFDIFEDLGEEKARRIVAARETFLAEVVAVLKDASAYAPCHCGAVCLYAQSDARLCWGKVEVEDMESTDGEEIYLHACRGHAPLFEGGDYQPKPVE